MKKTIEVHGMSCGHCEKRVQKELEAITGVNSAEVSAANNKAVVTFSKEVDKLELRKAVEKAGYEFVKIVK